MLAGCTDQGPPMTPQLRVIEGDRQVARVGTLLPVCRLRRGHDHRRSAPLHRWGRMVGAVTTDLTQDALWPWHVDVEWIPSRDEFWAVYNVKTASGCTTPAVFLASSGDGVTWQGVSRPLLAKGRIPEFEDIVYRSTFAYDPFTDAVTLWYSGARFEGSAYVWKAAVERRHRAEVFANLTSIEDGNLFTPPPAPLIDWP
jgi:hypothetical protein